MICRLVMARQPSRGARNSRTIPRQVCLLAARIVRAPHERIGCARSPRDSPARGTSTSLRPPPRGAAHACAFTRSNSAGTCEMTFASGVPGHRVRRHALHEHRAAAAAWRDADVRLHAIEQRRHLRDDARIRRARSPRGSRAPRASRPPPRGASLTCAVTRSSSAGTCEMAPASGVPAHRVGRALHEHLAAAAAARRDADVRRTRSSSAGTCEMTSASGVPAHRVTRARARHEYLAAAAVARRNADVRRHAIEQRRHLRDDARVRRARSPRDSRARPARAPRCGRRRAARRGRVPSRDRAAPARARRRPRQACPLTA